VAVYEQKWAKNCTAVERFDKNVGKFDRYSLSQCIWFSTKNVTLNEMHQYFTTKNATRGDEDTHKKRNTTTNGGGVS